MGHADAAVASAERRYPQAIAAFDRALSLDPNIHWTHGMRGLSYLGLGNFETAHQSCTTRPLSWVSQMCIAIVGDKLGDKIEAQSMLGQMKAESGDAMAYQYASIYAQKGEMQTALDWLETAYRLKDPGLAWLKADFLVDPLREEPGFQEIERKLNFPN